MFVCTSCTVCHCRQQVWIFTLLLSRGLQLFARLVSKSERIHKTQTQNSSVLPTDSCPNNSMHRGVYKHNLGPEKKKSALSVTIAHLWALNVTASFKLGVSQFTNFRVAFCHCFAPCPCSASCTCCHDPFVVRSAQTCPPFTGFTLLAHPSRCSRSTLTTVCFCVLVFRDHVESLCLFQAAVLHQIHQRLITFIL